MNSIAASDIPPDLHQLQLLFDSWRASRTSRSAVPRHLIDAARSLLDRYSISAVCRAARLHPRSLKRLHPLTPAPAVRSVADPTHHKQSQPTAFFSLPPQPSVPATLASTNAHAPYRLQLERPDGARLILDLPSSEASRIDALCAAFLHL